MRGLKGVIFRPFCLPDRAGMSLFEQLLCSVESSMKRIKDAESKISGVNVNNI